MWHEHVHVITHTDTLTHTHRQRHTHTYRHTHTAHTHHTHRSASSPSMFALDFRFAVAAYQRHSSATLSNAKLATSFPFYVSGREDGFLRYLGAEFEAPASRHPSPLALVLLLAEGVVAVGLERTLRVAGHDEATCLRASRHRDPLPSALERQATATAIAASANTLRSGPTSPFPECPH